MTTQVNKSWELTPDVPVQYLRGVGSGRAALLEAAGLRSVRDLLFFFPFRFEDRRNLLRIGDLRRIDAPVTLRGRILSASLKTSPVKRLKIFEAILDDGSGTVMLVWFNQPFLKDQIRKGHEIVIYGQPRLTSYGRLQFDNPDYEHVDPGEEAESEGVLLPVYSSVSSIPSKVMRKIVGQALEALPFLSDPLPEDLRRRFKVADLQSAIYQLHYPEDVNDEFLAMRSPAHRRMILEEFFTFQLALRLRRAAEEEKIKRRKIAIDDALRADVRRVLPFSLTTAQKRVLKEIAADLQSDRPMYRLLQGDVGSGKTIVALISALIAIRNGFQVALLAPTEILADQHYERIAQLLEGSDVRLAKLTGSTSAQARPQLLRDLAAGRIDLIVGTHALIEPKVVFKSLALAIVDEQHRFGVAQRQKLFAKADVPDILVMTATPIPRSLAIAMYGDLELSVIDELPPGREPIKTYVRGSLQLPKVFRFVEEQLAEGAQAYVVYPIIEESEKLDVKPLMIGAEEVREALPGRRIGVLHGRMSFEEKDGIMRRFKAGEIDVLVSTTVIEVGIDVPNASVMIVVGADRFGFAQLHQLRGRVGRGTRKSFCILIRDERTQEEAKERLATFARTEDGFAVAERDLEMRGAGDLVGTRQSGLARFRFGNILRDHKLMEVARDTAIDTISEKGVDGGVELLKLLDPEAFKPGVGKD